VAAADGRISTSETGTLTQVARLLGLPEEDVRTIRRQFVDDASASYAVLGVDPLAPVEEIKRAFKRLAARHHPDAVAHLGPKAVEAATERFHQLQSAYEAIRQERGF